MKIYFYFFSMSFIVLSHIYIYDPFWINFGISCKEEFQFYSFAHKYPIALEPFVEKIIFSH